MYDPKGAIMKQDASHRVFGAARRHVDFESASRLRIATAACAAGLLSLGAPPAESFAQEPVRRNAVRLEATYIAGAAYYSRRVAESWYVGGGAGAGVDLLEVLWGADLFAFGNRNLTHAEFLHLAAFASWQPSRWFRGDLGLRAATVLCGDSEFSGADFFEIGRAHV